MKDVRAALTLVLGMACNYSSRICHWKPSQGGGIGGTKWTFYNQAFNTFPNYPVRTWAGLKDNLQPAHWPFATTGTKLVNLADARGVREICDVWITDPPYADAVNYEELSEFFLAWYVPHLKAVFPDWYTDSMRNRAVKGDDAPFRVAMAECYRHLAENMPDDGMQVLMFTHKSTDVWEDLALIMWSRRLAGETGVECGHRNPRRRSPYRQLCPGHLQHGAAQTYRRQDGLRRFHHSAGEQAGQRSYHPHAPKPDRGGLARCGYTDTDYLLAAQAAAAEVVTGYATIDGVDLDAELRTPNNQRGRSALRTLMENAKRTATDFLVPPAMERAIKKVGGGDAYQFWRQFCAEEKFLLKGLEGEAQGVFKIGAFQDLGRAYGLWTTKALLGPTRANDTRTSLPEELPRPEALRFDEVPSSDRGVWQYSPTRQIYHALKLLADGADVDRAVKHLVDSTDFWNLRTTRLAAILGYLQETTTHLPHWVAYQDALSATRDWR